MSLIFYRAFSMQIPQKQRRILQRFWSCLLTLLFVIVSVFPLGSVALAQADSSLPTWIVQFDAQNVLLPDWSNISLSQLPAIAQAGQFDGSAFSSTLGYDLSRVWQAGMTPDQYLKLGDLSEALQPEVFSLGTIAQLTQIDLNQIALSAFTLVAEQTLAQLATAIPTLKQLPIRQIAPIAALLTAKAVGIDLNRSLGEVLAEQPQVAQLKLGNINLSPFSIQDISNLDAVQLQDFTNWQNSRIADIPGLNQVPLASMPQSIIEVGGLIMRIDTIYAPAEVKRQNTISGSDVDGFSVACETNCGYIELDDLENTGREVRGTLEGKQWISGKYQQVEGGHGILRQVNGGKEPTGRLPFGKAFKVVVMEPSETSDTVDTALFFRICHKALGCTPYFIGPVPFFRYHRDALIFVGSLDHRQSRAVSEPVETEPDPKPASTTVAQPTSTTPCSSDISKSSPGQVQGVNLEDLKGAIASIESDGSGGYKAIGKYGCDADGLCGRGLGKYQFMNYNPYAERLITAKPGGQAFLERVRRGDMPSDTEMMQFFPPEDQDTAFRNDLANKLNVTANQIDPTTGKPFSNLRLIERVAQKHYGGDYSKTDRADLVNYGSRAVKRYQAIAGSPSLSKACVKASAAKSKTSTKPSRRKSVQTTTKSKPQSSSSSSKGKSTGKYSYPIDPGQYTTTGEFGEKRGFPVSHTHKGHDFSAPLGTPFKAIDGGVVTFAGRTDPNGYGSLIIIKHDNGSESWYAHPMGFFVKEKDKVAAGQVIGRVGQEGDSTGPHLHLELHRPDGTAIDPMPSIHYVRK